MISGKHIRVINAGRRSPRAALNDTKGLTAVTQAMVVGHSVNGRKGKTNPASAALRINNRRYGRMADLNVDVFDLYLVQVAATYSHIVGNLDIAD